MSSELKPAFTPGPWSYDNIRALQRYGPLAERDANARLMATAPELYDTLKRLLHELEWVNEQLDLMPDDYADALTFAQAALAKARGEVSA